MPMNNFSWCLTSPIEVSLNLSMPTTIISKAILAQCFNTSDTLSTADDTGHDTFTGPLMVSTRKGVYVTSALPARRVGQRQPVGLSAVLSLGGIGCPLQERVW